MPSIRSNASIKITTKESSSSMSSKESTTIKSLAVVKGNVAEDCGVFHLPNGDVYEGFFEVKKKEKTLKAQGSGTYTTAHGDKYSGVWDKDTLTTDVKIEYKDNSVYMGDLVKWEYTGSGMYQFPDGTSIGDNFKSNVPVGPEVILIDPSSHKWSAMLQGKAALFRPNNHYYDWASTEALLKSQLTLQAKKSKSVVIMQSSHTPLQKLSSINK